MLKGKASRGLKAERTRQYVSILIRGTTQPLSEICIFWQILFEVKAHGPYRLAITGLIALK